MDTEESAPRLTPAQLREKAAKQAQMNVAKDIGKVTLKKARAVDPETVERKLAEVPFLQLYFLNIV